MKKNFEQVFTVDGKTLVMRNVESDPAMWIVDILEKSFLGKKKMGSYWFSLKEDAEEFIRNYPRK